MYKIQFETKQKEHLDSDYLLSKKKTHLNSLDTAVIVFDDNKKCLFFSPIVESILGDCFDIFLLENWFSSLEENFSDKSQYFMVEEIPLLSKSIRDLEIDNLEISVSRIHKHDCSIKNLACYEKNKSNFKILKNTSQKTENYLHYLAISNINQDEMENKREKEIFQFDITENIEEKFLHYNFCDHLTGLPNYNLLFKYIENAIEKSKNQEKYIFVVLFLDINRFKVINSSLGRTLGDKLLIAIARRLKQCLRAQDIVARIGSDEFAILLENIDHIKYATSVAERLHKELTVPFDINGYEVFAEISIGIAVGTKEYSNPEDLLRDAELAMSDAKKHSKSYYQLFERSMRGRAMTSLQLENDLRWAIKRQEFILHYQPIVSLADNKMKGFEVLVRWRHPLQGLVSPGKFIPLAEDTGLIISLGSWVLREACLQMRTWQLQFDNISTWKISVNISGKQLAQPNFVKQVKGILKETKLEPKSLKLEITESSLVEDTESTITKLKELKNLGIEFSLDDFGTGYSSLSYLHQFPFDTLKIDRSFVSSIDSSSERLNIIRAIITLARNLGMDTIAEGIETINQLAQLKALKCEYGQGYFLSKPLNKNILENSIVRELANTEDIIIDNYNLILKEQIATEQLLLQIEQLRQEVEQLKQEKTDLEIMLDTTTEHADIVEFQLRNEISDRKKAQVALHQANKELEKLSVLDSLTQVANRRRFDDYLLEEWQNLKQQQVPISLILCDIDYFKLYNDNYGHPIGDYCLQQVALAIECGIQSFECLVARYGGEEFGVVLPGIDGTEALKIAENIRESVNNLKIAHKKSQVNQYITLSLGVYSVVPNSASSPELLIAYADKALYAAKEKGRNCAQLFVE